MGTGTTSLEVIQLYVKAGVDGERMGACPFCQRVFMVLSLKARENILKFKVITVNPAKPPPEFKTLGLKHVPAVIYEDDGCDAVDDIITFLDKRFPGGGLEYVNPEADLTTKDFFFRFCFYIKAVSQDSCKLTSSLEKLNAYLEASFKNLQPSTNTNESQIMGVNSTGKQYLCGDHLTHLDCEILPKLQHLRVAAKALKNYDIPISLRGLWRYLYTAYSETAFVQTCPCDQEIVLHWNDRPEVEKMSHKKHSMISKETPKYSLDIPVHASVATIID